MNINNFGSISVTEIDTSGLSSDCLREMYEIEQDMWSRGLGEYLKCKECSTVFSKSDIYDSEKWSESVAGIRVDTVAEIERKLGVVPCCLKCNGETQHICTESHLQKIKNRHASDESFLTLARNQQGKIIGLMDGFSSSFRDVFEREFYDHFDLQVLDIIEDRFGVSPDTKVFTVSSLGMDEKHSSLRTTNHILKNFTAGVPQKYDQMPVVVEAIVSSVTYTIFRAMGAKVGSIPSDFPEVMKSDIKHKDFNLDILFQMGGILDYKTSDMISPRDLILKHREKVS